MKKLMIVAAAVMLAGMTQAASFTWGTPTGTSGKLVDDKGVVQTSVTGGSIALVLLGTDAITGDTTYTWLADATFTSSTKASTNGRISNTYNFTWTDGGENLIDNGSVVTVLFKDTAGNYSKLVDAATGNELDPTYTFSGITMNTWNNTTSQWNFATANYQTVPEPTSGLLMLLGMAGLALRRRRA